MDPRAAAAIKAALDQKGRAHLPGFLPQENAAALYAEMQSLDWRIATHTGEHTIPPQAATFDAMDRDGRDAFLKDVHDHARRDQFQYLYDEFRLSDACLSRQMPPGALRDFYLHLNSDSTLDAFRQMTGDPGIGFVDAVASRYRAGHFLTAHDDRKDGDHRRFAYVFNLTPDWRPDWGGLLTFFTDDAHVSEAFTPRWRALNLFKVPQLHAVSVVAPFTRGDRFSVTGWLRAQRPPTAIKF